MARKGAFRSVSKIVKRCPHCGEPGPKELVEGPKRFEVVAFVLCAIGALFTCGLTLLLVPLYYKRSLEAYCEECGEAFSPE